MIAIVVGFVGILMITIIRSLVYLKIPIKTSEKLRKIFLFTDLRRKSIESFETLWQIASLLWIAFGLTYNALVKSPIMSDIFNDTLVFIMIFGPPSIIIALGHYLKRRYWDSQE